MVWPKGKSFSAGHRAKLGKNSRGLPGHRGVHGVHKPGCNCNFCLTKRGELMGALNPNWRGGPGYPWDNHGWKAARQQIWERDVTCGVCDLPPDKRKFHVHHKISRRDGGSNELSNLVALHDRCHRRVHMGTAAVRVGR